MGKAVIIPKGRGFIVPEVNEAMRLELLMLSVGSADAEEIVDALRKTIKPEKVALLLLDLLPDDVLTNELERRQTRCDHEQAVTE